MSAGTGPLEINALKASELPQLKLSRVTHTGHIHRPNARSTDWRLWRYASCLDYLHGLFFWQCGKSL